MNLYNQLVSWLSHVVKHPTPDYRKYDMIMASLWDKNSKKCGLIERDRIKAAGCLLPSVSDLQRKRLRNLIDHA